MHNLNLNSSCKVYLHRIFKKGPTLIVSFSKFLASFINNYNPCDFITALIACVKRLGPLLKFGFKFLVGGSVPVLF